MFVQFESMHRKCARVCVRACTRACARQGGGAWGQADRRAAVPAYGRGGVWTSGRAGVRVDGLVGSCAGVRIHMQVCQGHGFFGMLSTDAGMSPNGGRDLWGPHRKPTPPKDLISWLRIRAFLVCLFGFVVRMEFPSVVLWRPEALDCMVLIPPEAWN